MTFNLFYPNMFMANMKVRNQQASNRGAGEDVTSRGKHLTQSRNEFHRKIARTTRVAPLLGPFVPVCTAAVITVEPVSGSRSTQRNRERTPDTMIIPGLTFLILTVGGNLGYLVKLSYDVASA